MTGPTEQAIESATQFARRPRSDLPFFFVMGGISSCFILLIVLLLAADLVFTSPGDIMHEPSSSTNVRWLSMKLSMDLDTPGWEMT